MPPKKSKQTKAKAKASVPDEVPDDAAVVDDDAPAEAVTTNAVAMDEEGDDGEGARGEKRAAPAGDDDGNVDGDTAALGSEVPEVKRWVSPARSLWRGVGSTSVDEISYILCCTHAILLQFVTHECILLQSGSFSLVSRHATLATCFIGCILFFGSVSTAQCAITSLVGIEPDAHRVHATINDRAKQDGDADEAPVAEEATAPDDTAAAPDADGDGDGDAAKPAADGEDAAPALAPAPAPAVAVGAPPDPAVVAAMVLQAAPAVPAMLAQSVTPQHNAYSAGYGAPVGGAPSSSAPSGPIPPPVQAKLDELIALGQLTHEDIDDAIRTTLAAMPAEKGLEVTPFANRMRLHWSLRWSRLARLGLVLACSSCWLGLGWPLALARLELDRLLVWHWLGLGLAWLHLAHPPTSPTPSA